MKRTSCWLITEETKADEPTRRKLRKLHFNRTSLKRKRPIGFDEDDLITSLDKKLCQLRLRCTESWEHVKGRCPQPHPLVLRYTLHCLHLPVEKGEDSFENNVITLIDYSLQKLFIAQ
jgi:hypothetical protein